VKAGSKQAAVAYDRALKRQADAYWAPEARDEDEVRDEGRYYCSECNDYIERELATQHGWHIYAGCEPICPSCAYMAARV